MPQRMLEFGTKGMCTCTRVLLYVYYTQTTDVIKWLQGARMAFEERDFLEWLQGSVTCVAQMGKTIRHAQLHQRDPNTLKTPFAGAVAAAACSSSSSSASTSRLYASRPPCTPQHLA